MRRVTLKTLRNEEVSDGRLRHLYFLLLAVAFVVYMWGVTLSPGVIVNGSYCVMVPKAPDYFDARSFGACAGIASFIAAVVLYCKSYYHLRRIKRKCVNRVGRRAQWIDRPLPQRGLTPPHINATSKPKTGSSRT